MMPDRSRTPVPDLAPVRRALVSVSDKAGLVDFCKGLAALGVELISTGGTARTLREAGLAVTSIDDVTGFPEMLDGRVKTLHPKVHGGILAMRNDPTHAQQLREHAIAPIDLVCVNLYPFEQTIARAGVSREESIENIDIGGPSMVRSAAKNHAFVAVVTSPAQYARVLEELRAQHGHTSQRLRAQLAADAFALTARYDGAIATYLARADEHASPFPPLLTLSMVKAEDLRYGENPHQRAALYRPRIETAHPSIARSEQLHGKELSYNNINDAAAALELACALLRVDGAACGACVIKHTNPCGAALAPSAAAAIDLAIAGDPLAAYGGILAVNRTVDLPAAQRIAHKDCFFEVVLAPGYAPEALALLQQRWANVRLLQTGPLDPTADDAHQQHPELRSIPGGMLVQDRDLALTPADRFEHRAGPRPTPAQVGVARFLEAVGRFLFSNAVVVGGPSSGALGQGVRMFGGGAGQMDRLTSCNLAIEKAGPNARGSVAYSDAFFPFADGPKRLIDAGVAMIVHPGGSKRDQDTLDLCAQHGVSCCTTGLRHFRH